MSKSLKRTLYVGIGGTGVDALLKIKRCFINSYGEIPPMIAFFAIDTDSSALRKKTKDKHGNIVSLNKSELLVCTVQNALAVYNKNPQDFDWVPANNVGKLPSIVGNGAGQVRSNGRFIALYNAQNIQDAIRGCVNRINALIPLSSPYTVALYNGMPCSTSINVFGSIAGGTGSGMIVDVLCLINKAMEQSGNTYSLYPWIVLPDVFKTIASGPAMNNVYYNAYGALKTLDYMQHIDPKKPNPVDFGYTTINTPLFDYAYLINNTNTTSITLNGIDDLMDIVAVSAFLPSGDIGDAAASPFDNVRAQQISGTYDIKGKKAWAASAGSAEFIYDSVAVARTYTHRLISLFCTDMINSKSTGVNEANTFVDMPNVIIREDNGRDDVIDSILSPAPTYPCYIDKNMSATEITEYINEQTGQYIQTQMQENYNTKLKNTQECLDKYINNILNKDNEGNIKKAISFLNALVRINDIGKNQLIAERADFLKLTANKPNWSNEMQSIRNSGIVGMFNSMNVKAKFALETRITDYVKNIREAERRRMAIAFFNDLNSYINNKINDLTLLVNNIQKLADFHRNAVLNEQNAAKSASKVQIYLHTNDVNNAQEISLSDTTKTQFYNELKLSETIGASFDFLNKKLCSIVQKDTQVAAAAGKTIDTALNAMPQADVLKHIDHIKNMASPLWSINPQGFATQGLKLDSFIIVGVDDKANNTLCKNPTYTKAFDTPTNKANFVSTFRDDRISVLIVEALVPVFAVNNFMTYKDDSDNKTGNNYPLANYINEQWESRMKSEDFSVLPLVSTDNIIQRWAYGFIFGFIHFDTKENTYWITSKNLGDPLDDYRYNLKSGRDTSYNIFKTMKLYNEIQQELNSIVANKGNEYFSDVINKIKKDNSYLKQYAQLSPTESVQLKTPPFAKVADLMREEIQSI